MNDVPSPPPPDPNQESTESGLITETVAGLRATFRSGRTRPAPWRRQQLRGMIALCQENRDAIAKALKEDMGRGYFESQLADPWLVEKEAAFALKHLNAWMRPEPVSTPLFFQPGKTYVDRQPLGTVLVLGAWNFPFNLTLIPAISALAAGNCVLMKPSELAPASADLIGELVPRYLDPEAVGLLTGGPEVAAELLDHRFDHIFYTGGGRVARIVMTAAAKNLTPVTLELGGKSPCIVDPTADLAVTSRRIASLKLINAGQACVSLDYILAHESIAEELGRRIVADWKTMFGEDPRQSPDYARIVNGRHFDRLLGLLDSGTIAHGGGHDREDLYIEPTLLTDVTEDSPVMNDEVFGPLLAILPYKTLDEAIEFINARPKALNAYIFTRDRQAVEAMRTRTSSGSLIVNDAVVQFIHRHVPFGGVGDSGMGAYHGRAGFETFSHRRAVLLKSNRLDVWFRYPPFTELKQRILKALV